MTRKTNGAKDVEESVLHHRRRRGFYCATSATMHTIVMIIMLVITETYIVVIPCHGFHFVPASSARGRMMIQGGRIHGAFRQEALRLQQTTSRHPHTKSLTFHHRQLFTSKTTTTQLFLVTEQDVISAVEEAEALWAKALEARKTANALSDRAEEEAEAAASNAQTINGKLNEQRASQTPITMEQLAQADSVARSNLDAGSLVNRALRATEEADRLEQLAEAALQKSEAQLEQHLVDFPDSALAE